MFTFKYTWDKESYEEFLVGLKQFNRTGIAVGITDGDKQHPDAEISINEIAMINEYGSLDGHTPSRPFMANTFARRGWVRDTLAEAARSVITGRASVTQALSKAGEIFADGVRQTLLDGVAPANAESTVEWKGHSDTLIGRTTGALYDAIGYRLFSAKK